MNALYKQMFYEEMDIVTFKRRLAQFSCLSYGRYPTPLEPLMNLTRHFNGPRLWIKRDDYVGPGLGGNKGRKLAFLMAEALQQKKRKVITFGGLQSNHARMTAAACAGLGLQAHLFFFERRPSTLAGNLLLDTLFGAKLHFIPFGNAGEASMTLETTNRLVRLVSTLLIGPGTYFMPVGGHNVTGCLGYVEAACELHEQAIALGWDLAKVTIVTAAGTGGTLAGLLAGFALLNSPIRVLGLDIGKLWRAFPVSLARLTSELCAAMGQAMTIHAEDVPLIEARYAGPRYAAFTAETAVAIQTVARYGGVILDPVYTGKAFAGLLDLVRHGRFTHDEYVVFLHTGGIPGLWAYEQQLMSI